jgi:hypothetical protein
MNNTGFEFHRHETANGMMYAAQCCVELFITDINNSDSKRKYAMEVHRWLGTAEITIDKLFDTCYEYGIFVLQTMEKYKVDIKNYEYALDSLQFQNKTRVYHESIMMKMGLAAIYRGYD